LGNRIYRKDNTKLKRRYKEPVNRIRIRKAIFTFIKYIIKNKYSYDGIANIKVKVKISLFQAVEAHRVARGQGSHIT
jgi:hypothetical protein